MVHLAGKAGVRPSLSDPTGYFRVNVTGTLRLLEICRELAVKSFILGSSSSVYGDDTPVPFREDSNAAKPISPYAASKRSAELICHTYSHLYEMHIAILRFFTVYGPRQRPDLAIHKFSKLIEKASAIELFGDGSTSRDYTFVSDIVDGVLAAEKWAVTKEAPCCETFNLGGSNPISLSRLVELIEKALGKKAKVDWKERQPGDVERTYADVAKSQSVLGYRPRISIEEGVSLFVQWLRQCQSQQ